LVTSFGVALFSVKILLISNVLFVLNM
jgi:hypothetical protein